jgi:hypothetical protein
MCIIAYTPKGVTRPTIDTLRQCWISNPDGAGLMWAIDGRLHIVKGLMTLDHFLDAWDRVPENCPVAAHFRIKSHGEKNAEMTHPFVVKGGKIAVMHNGMIADTGATYTGGKSDTCLFVEEELNLLPKGWECNGAVMKMMSHRIGLGSKLVFMRYDGEVWFANESQGTWEKGVWYSNYSFRAVRVVTRRVGYYAGGSTGHWDDTLKRWVYDDEVIAKGRKKTETTAKKDEDTRRPLAYPAVDPSEEVKGQPAAGGSRGIFWNKKSGKWFRPTKLGKGVMLYDWDVAKSEFVCLGYAEWSSFNAMEPAKGEEGIEAAQARAHFNIPESWTETQDGTETVEIKPDDIDMPSAATAMILAEANNPNIHA